MKSYKIVVAAVLLTASSLTALTCCGVFNPGNKITHPKRVGVISDTINCQSTSVSDKACSLDYSFIIPVLYNNAGAERDCPAGPMAATDEQCDTSTKSCSIEVSQGYQSAYKGAVAAATTAALTAFTYSNGTITANASGALAAQDGVTLALGDSLLIKDETGGNAPYNGAYFVASLGSVGTPFVLVRKASMNSAASLAGSVFNITGGTVNNGRSFVLPLLATDITLGTTALSWIPTMSAAFDNVCFSGSDTASCTGVGTYCATGDWGTGTCSISNCPANCVSSGNGKGNQNCLGCFAEGSTSPQRYSNGQLPMQKVTLKTSTGATVWNDFALFTGTTANSIGAEDLLGRVVLPSDGASTSNSGFVTLKGWGYFTPVGGHWRSISSTNSRDNAIGCAPYGPNTCTKMCSYTATKTNMAGGKSPMPIDRTFVYYDQNPLSSNGGGNSNNSIFMDSLNSCSSKLTGSLSEFKTPGVITTGLDPNPPPVTVRRRLAGDLPGTELRGLFTKNDYNLPLSKMIFLKGDFGSLNKGGIDIQLPVGPFKCPTSVNCSGWNTNGVTIDPLIGSADKTYIADIGDPTAFADHAIPPIGATCSDSSTCTRVGTTTDFRCAGNNTLCIHDLNKWAIRDTDTSPVPSKAEQDRFVSYVKTVPALEGDGVNLTTHPTVRVQVSSHLVFASQLLTTGGVLRNTCYDTHNCVKANNPSTPVAWDNTKPPCTGSGAAKVCDGGPAEANAVCLSAGNSPNVLTFLDSSKAACLIHYDDDAARICVFTSTTYTQNNGQAASSSTFPDQGIVVP